MKKANILPDNESKAQNTNSGPVDFETAIEATGFGRFNIVFLMVMIPCALTSLFETTSMAYVIPAAHCDLDLSLDQKGFLNAITYLGMIIGASFSGVLVDKLGRRKLLLYPYFLVGSFTLLNTLSKSFALLASLKFINGIISTGPLTALPTYICELHSKAYRARIQMVLGLVYGIGNIFLPVLASFILPLKVHWTFLNAFIEIHAWNIFILISSLPAILSGIAFIFMPDSPKYLMTSGQNQRALEVFRTIYSLNSGQPEEAFPIKELVNELKEGQKEQQTVKQKVQEGLKLLAPLFKRPFVIQLIFMCIMQALFVMAVNTLRLWLPQIFQAIHEFQVKENSSSSLCSMLDSLQPTIDSGVCSVNLEGNFSVYLNSMIIGMVQVINYFIAAMLLNKVGKKKILYICGLTSTICVVSLYFSQSTAMTLVLASLNLSLANICNDVVVTISVVIFPTSFRATTVALGMICGRLGSLTGNLLFPVLLKAGCAPPFFLLGALLIIATLFTVVLPNTDKKSLQ